MWMCWFVSEAVTSMWKYDPICLIVFFRQLSYLYSKQQSNVCSAWFEMSFIFFTSFLQFEDCTSTKWTLWLVFEILRASLLFVLSQVFFCCLEKKKKKKPKWRITISCGDRVWTSTGSIHTHWCSFCGRINNEHTFSKLLFLFCVSCAKVTLIK